MSRLEKKAADLGVVIPQPATLAKYGLDSEAWLEHLEGAGWKCPVCLRFPSSGRFVTDHEHIRGWSKLPKEERPGFVRGVICWHCNRYLLAGSMDSAKARRVARYLEEYEGRRPVGHKP